MPRVTFEREQVVVEARAGQRLLEVCEQAGIDVFRGMWPGLHCRRLQGWCNRCKVWVLPQAAGAVNEPTGAEKLPARLNGRVAGSLRLACQVRVNGDVAVHTRAGGPEVKPRADWQPTSEPSAWKERWERRHEGKAAAEEGAPAEDK